ncbi:MAG: hypothetical protein V1875_01995 [Candidatus Altiarchaeota archaeon]
MRYVSAVIIAMFAGFIVMYLPSNVQLPVALAMMMLSIFINEATLLHRIEELEGKLLKK